MAHSPAAGIPAGGPQPTEIEVAALNKAFGRHTVLRGVTLEIQRGEIVAIVGASGSGKTVLLDIITGLIVADSGSILVANHHRPGAPLVDLSTLDEDGLDEVRLHWSMVFQRNALFSGTVFDNVALWFREHTELAEQDISRRVRDSLSAASLDVEDVLAKTRDELSGGMAKRVAIARAIAVDPAVIFYDEPTTGLDPVLGANIHELIFRTQLRPLPDGSPRTTVIVTHDKELLRRLRPHVIMLHEGSICFNGTHDAFSRSDCPPAKEYLRIMPILHDRAERPSSAPPERRMY